MAFPKTTNQLIEEHLDYAIAIVVDLIRSVSRDQAAVDDIKAAAWEGLTVAAQRFDPTKGIAFKTFAHYRVRGTVIDHLRRNGRLPKSLLRRLRAQEAKDAISEDAAGEPEERSDATRDPAARERATFGAAVQRIFMVDVLTQQDAISDDGEDGPENRLIDEELRTKLRAAMSRLEKIEREVVLLHYTEGRTYDEIADALDLVNKFRVKRVMDRALDHLRRAFSGEGAPAPA